MYKNKRVKVKFNNGGGLKRDKYVGATGVVVNDFVYGKFRYVIKFDDIELEKSNHADGLWLWSFEELEEVVDRKANSEELRRFFFDESSFKNRVISDNERYIINYPCVICILKDNDGKIYKGVAKVLDGDTWSEAKGMAIAKKKAEIKKLTYELKQLCK